MIRPLFRAALFILLSLPLQAQTADLRYSLKEGTRLRYKITESTKAFSQIQTGLQSTIDRDAETFADIVGEAVEPGVFTILLTRDTTFVTEHAGSTRPVGATPDFLNIYARKPIRFRLSPSGHILSVQPLQPLNRFAGLPDNLTDSYLARQALFLPALPQRTVSVGTAWTENRKDTLNAATNGKTGDESDRITFISTKVTYTAEAIEVVQGLPCLKITWYGTVFTEGKHIARTGEVFSEDEEQVQGTLWFAMDLGRLVQLKTTSTTESTMVVIGSETEIRPSSITVSKTISLLPS